MQWDFGGYATRFDVKCADGRIIRKGSFKDNDGERVPLVFQHDHKSLNNIVGHSLLEARDDGMYCYCKFNDTDDGKTAKALVEHGDITKLSIYANQIKQVGSSVIHGMIREVSLVLSGANPGAYIDNLCIEHSDGEVETVIDEAIIYSGEDFEPFVEHADSDNGKKNQNESDGGSMKNKDNPTIKEVFNTLNEQQKTAVYAMIGAALEERDEADEDDEDVENSDEGVPNMKTIKHYNAFEAQDDNGGDVLTHDEMQAIFADAQKTGSLKNAVISHGIENLEILFPEAKALTPTPDMIMRDQEWVSKLWAGFRKTPFSRIKTVNADITKDEARARGYIKGKKKLEEQFSVFKRQTTPQTVYKLQRMHRDDIIDITDFDVVAWIKGEMRIMLNEELSRAALIGDGREAGAEDKINESNIRPILSDDELYTHHVTVTLPTNATNTDWANGIVDAAAMARIEYKGSGNPTAYFDSYALTKMLLARDTIGHRLYNNVGELATALRVKEIVEVPVMENLIRTDDKGAKHKVMAIIVNPVDYSIGADRGGAVTMFDDFDIDYNRYTYLIETRCSGALTKVHSAMVLEMDATSDDTSESVTPAG